MKADSRQERISPPCPILMPKGENRAECPRSDSDMFQSLQDSLVLNNGVRIPCLGYGTWQTPEGVAKEGTLAALRAGYRLIDSASGYGTEADVGSAVRESGIPREEIFVTTKHWIDSRGYTKTIEAAETSLKTLGLDYIDLYLIHWPCVSRTSEKWKEINAGTWRGFEKLYRDGKIRAIGVSNFLPEHIKALEETAEILPSVNQIEFHPGYDQPALVQWCQNHGIVVEAWSPLGCGAVLSNPILSGLSKKYGRTEAQICLRYALQKNVIPLSKSTHADRIVSNAQIFDFDITEDDMLTIATMPPVGYSTYHPAEAPADSLFGGSLDID